MTTDLVIPQPPTVVAPRPVTPRDTLAKADLALSDLQADGGYLSPAQSKKFIQQVIGESDLLKQVFVFPMSAPVHELNLIGFLSGILKEGVDGAALDAGDRSKPTTAKVELNAKSFKAEVWLEDTVVEDNIEQNTFPQTVMGMLAKRLALDIEQIMVQGDTGLGSGPLSVLDGLIVQATSNVVDFEGARLNKENLSDMIKGMPTRFKRMKRDMKFCTSFNAEEDYRNQLASRATAAGDRYVLENVPVTYGGVAVMPVDTVPDDLGTGNDETITLLTPLKNIVYGIWRRIKIEVWRDVRAGVLVIVATVRFDVKYVEEEAVVKGINILNS